MAECRTCGVENMDHYRGVRALIRQVAWMKGVELTDAHYSVAWQLIGDAECDLPPQHDTGGIYEADQLDLTPEQLDAFIGEALSLTEEEAKVRAAINPFAKA